MGEPAEDGVVEPDFIDIIDGATGDPKLTRKILETLAEHKHIVVALRSQDIQQAAFILSTILDGVPPTLFMAALAEQGAYIVIRPELRHDLVAQADGTMLQTHPADRCEGGYCVIHNPSDHPLKDAPLHWDDTLRRTDRVCKHDQHHPDPDHLAHVLNEHGLFEWIVHRYHDCDGCCKAEPTGPAVDFLRKDTP